MQFRLNITFRTSESLVQSDYVAHLERVNDRLESDLRRARSEIDMRPIDGDPGIINGPTAAPPKA